MHSPEQIRAIADSLLPGFIPKDANENLLTFHFTLAPNKTYKVEYQKILIKGKAEWNFVAYQEVKPGV